MKCMRHCTQTYLEPRCKEHHSPCIQCKAKNTLYNTERSENWKILRIIKSNMWTMRIHDNICLIYYEVQMKIPGILKYIFPIIRYKLHSLKQGACSKGIWREHPGQLRRFRRNSYIKNVIYMWTMILRWESLGAYSQLKILR